MANGVIKTISSGQDGNDTTPKTGTVQDTGGTNRNFVNQTFPSTLRVNSQVSYEVDSRGNAYHIVAR